MLVLVRRGTRQNLTAPRFKGRINGRIKIKLGLLVYIGRVTSADIIPGLDPQELDRLLLSAKTACSKSDALANAGRSRGNSCMHSRLLAAPGLGVCLCPATGSAAHTPFAVSTGPVGVMW